MLLTLFMRVTYLVYVCYLPCLRVLLTLFTCVTYLFTCVTYLVYVCYLPCLERNGITLLYFSHKEIKLIHDKSV